MDNHFRHLPKLVRLHETAVERALTKAHHGWQIPLDQMLLVVVSSESDASIFCHESSACPMLRVRTAGDARHTNVLVYGGVYTHLFLEDFSEQRAAMQREPSARAAVDGRPEGTIAVVAVDADENATIGYMNPTLVRGFCATRRAARRAA